MVEGAGSRNSSSSSLPAWHEAELGTRVRSRVKLRPEIEAVEFPEGRWPTAEEASYYGFDSVKDWYIKSRTAGNPATGTQVDLEKEFEDLRRQELRKQDQERADHITVLVGHLHELQEAPVEKETRAEDRRGVDPTVGVALTTGLADVEPLAWKRVRDQGPMKRALADTLRSKWAEAAT